MDSLITKEVDHLKAVEDEEHALAALLASAGDAFPGSDYHPPDRKAWMAALGPSRLPLRRWFLPGTHDSATNEIGIPLITRPLAQCQDLSIYDQLALGTRVLDIRVQQDRLVCHGILTTYSVDVVLAGLKRFLSETHSELVLLEIRTEFGHQDPPGFDKYLAEQLGEFLIPQDEAALDKTIGQLLPKRVVCVWKPLKAPAPKRGDPLWSAAYLKDNLIDTDLPMTKFDSNMKFLGKQAPVTERRYFYRVENTVTPQANNPVVWVRPVTERIHKYARLFISQAFAKGFGDRLQVFSTDFIDGDFVDACVGLNHARIQGKA